MTFVSDLSQVQTKSRIPLAESQSISVVLLENDTDQNLANYLTTLDPAIVVDKNENEPSKLIDLSDSPIPSCSVRYNTNVGVSNTWYKSIVTRGGIVTIKVGSSPLGDIGSVIGIGDYDWWHKSIVTDLTPGDVEIANGKDVYGVTSTFFTTVLAQEIIYPVSSRHVVMTSDGVIHAVACWMVSGVSRIIYLKSVDGGTTWTQTYIDNDDGHNYVFPSITCDKNNGIHITYSRWDKDVFFDTFWLYAGGSIPSGFELLSGPSGVAYHRLLGGKDSTYSSGCSYDHGHSGGVSGGSADPCDGFITGAEHALFCGWHHDSFSSSLATSSLLPLSRSLKLLVYHGIPPEIPADIIIPFKSTVPSPLTRYSDQDGYRIYCSDDVGTVVGATSHTHLLSYSLTGGDTLWYQIRDDGPYRNIFPDIPHSHIGSVNINSANNNPPTYGVYLGKVSTPLSSLPTNALLMVSDSITLPDFTDMSSSSGKTLYNKFFEGYNGFTDLGGDETHYHSDTVFKTVGASACHYVYTEMWALPCSRCEHGHIFTATTTPTTNYAAYFFPHVYSVDADLDISAYGNDVFYRYISPGGVTSAPVNVSQLKQCYPAFHSVCLADGQDDLHVLWASFGINTHPERARICYKKMTGGSWGSREDLTTDDNHHIYPSMDIDLNGDIHTAWFDVRSMQSVQYRKKASGVWGSIEDVDTSSYVAAPSNIVVDHDCNAHLIYGKCSNPLAPVYEILYRKRDAATGVWSSATNLSPGKAAAGYTQFPGQITFDNKKNVLITWNAKGCPGHTSVYHPVYRYVKSDGTILPDPTTDEPIDLFPNDSNSIIYPNVFWHSYPLVEGVYHNLPVKGLAMLYLYNVRGTDEDTADLRFYASEDAIVGDVGLLGNGGSGDGDITTQGGARCEIALKTRTYTATIRGHINKTLIHKSGFGGYVN